jgi:bacteriophage CI repressor helix-turn-helix domain|nr:MAG TPA: helix-turn-helix domain protein [Caudoviricetes sp.]
MQIRLKEIMQERGITSVALASMVGLSKNTISNLINNKTMPSIDTLNEIAEKINVPLWQLFVSPEEVAGGGEFVAFVKDGNETYQANNLSELEKIVQEIKENKE